MIYPTAYIMHIACLEEVKMVEIAAIAGMITAICAVYKVLSARVDASIKYLNGKKLDKDIFETVVSRITDGMAKLEAHIEKISDRADKQGEMLAEIKAILDIMRDGKHRN